MRRDLLPFAFSLFPFFLLATANSAGYRYGASDLAFYGPAVMRRLDPGLFPRDGVVIDAQARLTLMDETVAAVARLTTENLPLLFLGLYIVTLALLAVGAAAVGEQLYRSRWAVTALLAALTLRHAVPKSGTNTLEGYFHPRQLAFAFGVIAVAAFLRGRIGSMIVALIGAALFHPTTTLWFGIWLTVAVFVSEARWRRALTIAAGGATLIAAWAATAGPLAGRFVQMDPEWIAAIADKEYLFPLQWSITTWILNLGYVPIIVLIYRARAAAGVTIARERGLVTGCLTLVAVFLIAVVLNANRLALAIQLQPARVFWMLDFLAIVYAVWAIAEGRRASERRAQLTAIAVLLVCVIRGVYNMRVDFPERPLFEVNVPGDWDHVTTWARTMTARDSGWLADPGHALLYGTSLRLAAGRDVFVEGVKDGAIGMYDRTVAFRTRDRMREIGDFKTLSVERARRLAADYGLDYWITEQDAPLPLRFQSGRIRVYQLR